jgi:hypothetical protein
MRSAASRYGNPTVKLQAMSKVDVAKEKIAYMRLWMALVLAVAVSLIGWLASNFLNITFFHIAAAAVSLIALAFGSYRLHKHIIQRINELEPM